MKVSVWYISAYSLIHFLFSFFLAIFELFKFKASVPPILFWVIIKMSRQLLCKIKLFKAIFCVNLHACPSVPLFCYTCVFPAISPLDCIRYPLKCPPGQVCLSSRAVGQRGEGALSHLTTFKYIKTEKKNWERKQAGRSVVSFQRAVVRVSPKMMFLTNLWFSGGFRVVLYEKSCILPSFCGITGEKQAMGLNFTFTNDCCNTHLCNGAATPATSCWTGTILTLLISYALWWTEKYVEEI